MESPVVDSGSLRLGLVQMRVDPGEPEVNLERAERGIGAARGRGAELVLLPEALDCGWTHPSAREKAGAIPGGAAFERMREAARHHAVHVCAGLVEREGERLFNAAVWVGPGGDLMLHHRKIHEIEFARSLYTRGDRLTVVESPWGRVGVMICADAFAPGLAIGRALGEMGARLVVSPCAWAVPPDFDAWRTPYGQLWMDSYQPLAREYGMVVAGCSNVGPVTAGEWRGWRCIGNSLVIGAGAEVLARGGHGEGAEAVLIVDVSLLRFPPKRT